MFDMTENDVVMVYQCLKGEYDLVLTNTSLLDAGFTIDTPIIVGKAHGQEIWLYVCEEIFIIDVMNTDHTAGTHWHPYDIDAAVKDMADFMNGKSDYEMESFPKA